MRTGNGVVGGVLAIWLLIVLGNLVFWGGLIYIALHFLHKLW